MLRRALLPSTCGRGSGSPSSSKMSAVRAAASRSAGVARAAPDGYTIDIGQWDTHVGSIIYKLDYDLQKDFEPIGLISNNPQLMVAKKDLPAGNLKELIAWMKANPDKINYVNQNAAANVTGVIFEKLTGQKFRYIPYRGAGPAMTDLVSGQVDLLVVQGAVALPQIRGGKIKAIANLSPQRSASMSDIPTSDESGVPGLYMSGWFGFFAPKGTPKDVIATLNSAMVQALAEPAVRSRFTELGLDVASREQQTPEGLAAFQKAEIEKWWPIIKEAGIPRRRSKTSFSRCEFFAHPSLFRARASCFAIGHAVNPATRGGR